MSDTFPDLKVLLKEYKASGKSIEEFVTEKLTAAGRTDAAEYVAKMKSAFSSIDEKFESLEKFKAAGHTRAQWLELEIDKAVPGMPTKEVGMTLCSAIKVMKGDADDSPAPTADYSGIGTVEIVKEFDNALIANVLDALNKKGE